MRSTRRAAASCGPGPTGSTRQSSRMRSASTSSGTRGCTGWSRSETTVRLPRDACQASAWPARADVSRGHSHALEVRSRAGIRAVSTSLAVLLATAVVQVVVYALSGSVALLADLIHNFGDALTA